MSNSQLKAIKQAVLAANHEVESNSVVRAPNGQAVLAMEEDQPLRVVTRVSTADNRYWGVQVGAFSNRHQAEKALLQTALRELQSLEGSERRIDYATVNGHKKYRARFEGLHQVDANMACARLRARNHSCFPVGPGS